MIDIVLQRLLHQLSRKELQRVAFFDNDFSRSFEAEPTHFTLKHFFGFLMLTLDG